ncbi:MAG: AbrB/MazE/SpoVT family DNA-binding domain-containing protein [Candidatus Euphemobacter frigidus]|nr:AbrB/MazE/SpoVT family DNA-binding domain-containing protein [Candidatus Euphemobacter frigidus]MDP8274803.1 AbrB/MazE/SpoVT family DNA-binding domain-containing protein [Candidatus Euphemobacter frigidus]
MTLMRAYARVDEEGRIPIPGNIRREAKLEPGQMVEIKIQGTQLAQHITIHARKAAK